MKVMETATIFREAPYVEAPPKKISIEEFLQNYREGAPGIKYEYNEGIIEQSEAMKFKEQYLVENISKKFEKTSSYQRGDRLVQELEIWTSEVQWRKPDLCLTTPEMVAAAAKGFEPIPHFIIEVISTNDKINEVKRKVREYFQAGVRMVWLIFPELEEVEIYRSPEDKETCTGSKICSAEPVIEGFKITAAEILIKP